MGWEVAELARRGFGVTGIDIDYTAAAVANHARLVQQEGLGLAQAALREVEHPNLSHELAVRLVRR